MLWTVMTSICPCAVSLILHLLTLPYTQHWRLLGFLHQLNTQEELGGAAAALLPRRGGGWVWGFGCLSECLASPSVSSLSSYSCFWCQRAPSLSGIFLCPYETTDF